MDDKHSAKVAEILGSAAGAASAMEGGQDDQDFILELVESAEKCAATLAFITASGGPTTMELLNAPTMLPTGTFLRMARLLERISFDD